MRCVVGLIAVVMAWSLCVSCVENEPPAQQQKKPVTILSPPVSAQPTVTKAQSKPEQRADAQKQQREQREQRQQQQKQSANAKVTPQVPAGAPAPPKGAQYTIFCARIEGQAHVERTKRLRDELMSRSNMNGWYVVHEDLQSLLYHGFYRSISDENDKKETARAQADLKRCKSLSTDEGRLFRDVMFVTLEAPDPVAPPDWNLVNSKGVWTIQIAAYKDSPLRKEAAVDAVREARKQGVEAYYYHGDTVSSVCIGAWPEEAVRVDSPSFNANDNLVVAQGDLPSQILDPVRDKRNIQVVQDKIQVVDPRLMQAIQQYPMHAVNGEVTVRRVNGVDVPDPSLLIRIPEPEAEQTAVTAGSGANEQQRAIIEQQRQSDLFGTSPSQSLGGGDLPPQQQQQQQQQQKQSKKQPPPPPSGLGKLKGVDG